MVGRFTGTVRAFTTVDVADLAKWIASIDFSEWHQQHRTQPDQLRPAMMTDLEWHGFKEQTDGLVTKVLEQLPGCSAYQRMLSVVMPGDNIPVHTDEQDAAWLARVHVPLTANDQALFVVNGEEHNLKVGQAYLVNTLSPHGVVNAGATPRVHFMFDVRHV